MKSEINKTWTHDNISLNNQIVDRNIEGDYFYSYRLFDYWHCFHHKMSILHLMDNYYQYILKNES